MQLFFTQQLPIVLWLQHTFAVVFSEKTMVFFSQLFPWIVSGVLLGFVVWYMIQTLYTGHLDFFDRFFWAVVFGVLVTAGLSELIKHIIAEPRPFLAGIHAIYEHGGYDAFPSGHTSLFTALAVGVWFRFRRFGFFLFMCALVIGIARVAVGIHWPLDIIAGLILGSFGAWVGNWVSSILFGRVW
jgi:undecaprenyl-diphosphatase